jgi:hypothetical protein
LPPDPACPRDSVSWAGALAIPRVLRVAVWVFQPASALRQALRAFPSRRARATGGSLSPRPLRAERGWPPPALGARATNGRCRERLPRRLK